MDIRFGINQTYRQILLQILLILIPLPQQQPLPSFLQQLVRKLLQMLMDPPNTPIRFNFSLGRKSHIVLIGKYFHKLTFSCATCANSILVTAAIAMMFLNPLAMLCGTDATVG